MDIRDRARVLRTLRAWTGLEQKDIAAGIGIGVATLRRAEIEVACSDKTWEAALAYFRTTHNLMWAGDERYSAIITAPPVE